MEVVISERAEEDLALVFAYLLDVNVAAAERFSAEVEQRLESLKDMPWRGAPRDDLQPGLRCVLLRTLLVLYTIGPEEVLILRIIDGRMDVDAEFHA
jgi:toxin ParE1/3/4